MGLLPFCTAVGGRTQRSETKHGTVAQASIPIPKPAPMRTPYSEAMRSRYRVLRRRQACVGTAASRTDGTEPECGPQSGGRHGRNPHGTSSAGAGPVTPDPGEHERDRVGFLHRGDGLPQREALAPRRSHRALGRRPDSHESVTGIDNTWNGF